LQQKLSIKVQPSEVLIGVWLGNAGETSGKGSIPAVPGISGFVLDAATSDVPGRQSILLRTATTSHSELSYLSNVLP
jgi:hypothetical protein